MKKADMKTSCYSKQIFYGFLIPPFSTGLTGLLASFFFSVCLFFILFLSSFQISSSDIYTIPTHWIRFNESVVLDLVFKYSTEKRVQVVGTVRFSTSAL